MDACMHVCVCECGQTGLCAQQYGLTSARFRVSETVLPCTPSKTRPAVVSMAVRSLLGGAPLRVFLHSLAHAAVDM